MNAQERKELRQYADTLLNGGALSGQQLEHLERLLQDPDAREFYLAMVEVDVHLPESIEHAEIIEQLNEGGGDSARHWLRWLVPAAAAAAAFTVGWLLNDPFEKLPDQKGEIAQPAGQVEPTARITSLIGVRWNQNPSQFLDTSEIDISSGLVELTYPTGVKVVIEGPAKYQITGENLGLLEYGRFVARVPDGAEGFTVSYANGKIVDLGTEFGCELTPSGEMKLGVFDGEVELYPRGSERKVKLTKNHAVEQLPENPAELASVPFDRDMFIREAPSREFPWHLDSVATKEVIFDVSHLIWSSGEFSGVFKWMRGMRGVVVKDVALYRGNVLIDRSAQTGTTGYLRFTKENVFAFSIPRDEYRRGLWQVRATIEPYSKKPLQMEEPWAEGVFLFEDSLSREATASDYLGKWAYAHNGAEWIREIKPGGKIDLYKDGKLSSHFEKATWKVEDGILRVWIPFLNSHEDHVLRDKNTLIFTDQPYRNARRVE